jgi:hypothetical protein
MWELESVRRVISCPLYPHTDNSRRPVAGVWLFLHVVTCWQPTSCSAVVYGDKVPTKQTWDKPTRCLFSYTRKLCSLRKSFDGSTLHCCAIFDEHKGGLETDGGRMCCGVSLEVLGEGNPASASSTGLVVCVVSHFYFVYRSFGCKYFLEYWLFCQIFILLIRPIRKDLKYVSNRLT